MNFGISGGVFRSHAGWDRSCAKWSAVCLNREATRDGRVGWHCRRAGDLGRNVADICQSTPPEIASSETCHDRLARTIQTSLTQRFGHDRVAGGSRGVGGGGPGHHVRRGRGAHRFTVHPVGRGRRPQRRHCDGVAQQPDGKIVVSGWAAINNTMRDENNRVIGAETDINGTPNQVAFVRRYNANGSPDTTFGNQATKFLPFPLGFDGVTPDSYWNTSVGWDIAVQSTGKIVMVKTTLNGLDARAVPFLIQAVRLNADGTRDTTFGTTTFGPQNGFAQAGFGGGQGLSLQGMSVAISPTSGKIAVAGSAINMDAFTPGFTDVYRPMVVQFNADGSLDTNFGGDDINNPGQKSGIFELPLGTATGRFLDVSYGPGDKLIASGYWTGADGAGQQLATESAELLVARINTNGTLDATYGAGGLGRFAQGIQAIGRSLVVNSDGSAVVAGYTDSAGSGQQFAPIRFAPDVVQSESATQRGLVVKFDANGQVDDTFGTDGARLLDPNTFRAVTSLIPRPQGGFYLGGHAGGDFAVAAMSAAGDLLTAFPTIKRSVGTGHDVPYALMRQTDGKLVLGGFTTNGTDRNLALMRLQAEPAVPVNVAPVLDNSGTPFYLAGVGSRLPVELTNGVLVSSFLATGAAGDPITDGNGDPDGIAVTAIDKSFGSWQYSTAASPVESDWIDMDAAGMVSASSALLLKADATTRVRLKSTLKPHHEGNRRARLPPVGIKARRGADVPGLGSDRWNGGWPREHDCQWRFDPFQLGDGIALDVFRGTAVPLVQRERAAQRVYAASGVRGADRRPHVVPGPLDQRVHGLHRVPQSTHVGDSGDRHVAVLLRRAVQRRRYRDGHGVSIPHNECRRGREPRTVGPSRQATAATGSLLPRAGGERGFGDHRLHRGRTAYGIRRNVPDLPDRCGRQTDPSTGNRRRGTPTSTRSQEQGDHIYTTNFAHEAQRPGEWRLESSRGFVRELSPSLPVPTHQIQTRQPGDQKFIIVNKIAAATPASALATSASDAEVAATSPELSLGLIRPPTPILSAAANPLSVSVSEPVAASSRDSVRLTKDFATLTPTGLDVVFRGLADAPWSDIL